MLSPTAHTLIEDIDNEIFVSPVTTWEVLLKNLSGKLTLQGNPGRVLVDGIDQLKASALDLTLAHTLLMGKLPKIHNDPFDRMLVCQAQGEGIPLLTRDGLIGRYDVETVW